MLKVKSPSKKDIEEVIEIDDSNTIDDPLISALTVQESMDDLSRTVSKEHAHEMLFLGQESYLDSPLMRVAAAIHSHGTDLNTVGLEAYPDLVVSKEGKLSDFADLVIEKVKAFIAKMKKFIFNMFKSNEKRDAALAKVKELDESAKLKDDSLIDVNPIYVDGKFDIHNRIVDIVEDITKFLLTDMFKIVNTMETYSVDIHRKLEGDFEFKDVSGLLDKSADLIYSIKVGLIAIIDGTAKSGKAELNGRNTFMLKAGEYTEYHFDFGDVANYEKLKFTDDKVKQALQLNMSVKKLDAEPKSLKPLGIINAKFYADELLKTSKSLSRLTAQYKPHLDSFEGMFKYNRSEVLGKLKDGKKEALAKKVMHSSEQMILTCMKLYSILTLRILDELDKSCTANADYVQKSIKAHDIKK